MRYTPSVCPSVHMSQEAQLSQIDGAMLGVIEYFCK